MLERLRIGPRLSILLAVMATLTAVVVGQGVNGMAVSNAGLKTVYEDRTLVLVQLNAVFRNMSRIQNNVVSAALNDSADERKPLLDEIDGLNNEINALWTEYLQNHLTAEEKVLIADIETNLEAYRASVRRVVRVLNAGDRETAMDVIRNRADPQFNAVFASLYDIIKLQGKIAGEQYADADAAFMRTLWVYAASTIVGLAVSLGLAMLIVRTITKPAAEVIHALQRLAESDVSAQTPGRDRRDEIGDIARALETLKQSVVDRLRLEAEERAALVHRDERRRRLENLTGAFDAAVGEVLDGVTTAADAMNEMSRNMTAVAEETQRQSAAVSTAAEQAGASVSAIASAGSQLSASIDEIARQVNRSADIATAAVTEVDETNQKMASLNESATRIGEVVNLINAIAHQTNLLALNATIEAARAGDAGKGFAVVASEVKTLAGQTAKATEEIAEQVEAVQGETRGAADAMRRIAGVINDMHAMSAAIAGAIEQQGAAVRDVANNVDQAAVGAQEVASNIAEVVEAARTAGRMAGSVQAAANVLSEESGRLRGSVQNFLTGVKAA